MIVRVINFHQEMNFFSFCFWLAVAAIRSISRVGSSTLGLSLLYLVHRNEFNGATEMNSSRANLHSLLLYKKNAQRKNEIWKCAGWKKCVVSSAENLNSNLLHLAWKCVMLSFHFEYIRKLLKFSKCLNLINMRSILFRLFLPTFLHQIQRKII